MQYGSNKRSNREKFFDEHKRDSLIHLPKGVYVHWCELCKCLHFIEVSSHYKKTEELANNSFNFNLVKPTFTDPISHVLSDGSVCKYTLTDGVVYFERNDRTGRHLATSKLFTIPERQLRGF